MNHPPPPPCAPELCALTSKRAGEDPIGTATGHPRTMLVELPLPWPRSLLEDTPKLPNLGGTLRNLPKERRVRPLALVPQGDLPPGLARVLLYRQPDAPWAVLHGREFVLPTELVDDLAEAFAHDDLATFGTYEEDLTDTRDVLVCTHGSVDAACGKLGYPLYRMLRERLAPRFENRLRPWRTSHFGGHRFAPTLLDFPSGRAWAHVTPRALQRLTLHTGDVRHLRAHQRGWTGADYWGQIAERAAFEHVGWEWLTYRRHSTTLDAPATTDPASTPDPPAHVQVALHFERPDGTQATCHASITFASATETRTTTGGELQRSNRFEVHSLHFEDHVSSRGAHR